MPTKRALAKAEAAELIDIESRLAGFVHATPEAVRPADDDQPE